MRWWICGVLIVSMAVTGLCWADEVVYVQGAQAPLYAAPQLGKAPIAVVGQGTALRVIDGNPRWYKVQGEQTQGWVVRFMVAQHPPSVGESAKDDAMEVLIKRARVRPSTYSTTAAARGLRAGGDGLDDAHRMDYHQVDEMEGFQPSPQEVDAFFQSEAGHE